MCEGQRLSTFFLCWSHFLRQALSLNLELGALVDELDSGPHSSPISVAQALGLQMCAATSGFMHCAGIQIQFLMPA